MKSHTQNNQKKTFILLSFLFFLNANAQTVTTFAGSGTQGFADGTGTAVRFSFPNGVAIDAAGNIFVADTPNNRIRKITAAGVVSTFAGSSTQGSADGTGTTAQFYDPTGVAIDAAGNVFVADRDNNRIRKITTTGVVSTLAGSSGAGFTEGTGTAARFYYPTGVAVDAAGNVFVADTNNNRIRKITAAGVVTTLAGSVSGSNDGTGTLAHFNYPIAVATDTAGNVFVADSGNNSIRKVTASGLVSTLAGFGTAGFIDGTGTAARFNEPFGVAVDAAGNVFVADEFNSSIRKITVAGVVSTLAGSSTQGFADGIGTAAQFFFPCGVALDAAGNVFVADTNNNRIRRITGSLGTANYPVENQVSIYPNPTTSIIYIDLEDITAAKATIFDINGRALQTENLIDNKSAINIGNLANGIYLMQLTTDKGTISKKIVKQ